MSAARGGRRNQPAGAELPVVLVVDDERPITELLAGLVADLGYAPVVASHGRQALALAQERHPSLVLTDLMMPFLDGVGLAGALRRAAAQAGRTAPPIILMTSAGTVAAQAAGADVVLHKPFELEHVAQLLIHYLGRAPGG